MLFLYGLVYFLIGFGLLCLWRTYDWYVIPVDDFTALRTDVGCGAFVVFWPLVLIINAAGWVLWCLGYGLETVGVGATTLCDYLKTWREKRRKTREEQRGG